MHKDNPHINKDELERFHGNRLTEEEKLELLGHISNCTFCADQFAQSFTKILCPAPANLKERILIRTEAETEKRLRNRFFFGMGSSKKLSFYLYTAKVCAAMCGALVILCSITFTPLQSPTASISLSDGHSSFITELNAATNWIAQSINSHMNSLVTYNGDENNVNQTN